jgi:predicted permease
MIARIRELWERVVRVMNRDRYTRELEEEMRAHVAMRVDANTENGMSPADAQITAHRRFGSSARLVEASREAWGGAWLEQRVHDVRIAMRGLRRNPGFTAAVILTISLGVAATTGVISVAYGVLLAPLPIRDADRVVILYGRNPNRQPEHFPLSGAEYTAFARETRTLSLTGAVQYLGAQPGYLHLGDTVATINGAMVTGAFFDVLGARPLVGRLLRPDDDLHIVPTPAVISERLWRSRFASDPKIVGLTTQLGLTRVAIVGVVAGGIDYPRGSDMWVSFRSRFPASDTLSGYHDVIGRIAPGATIASVRTEFTAFVLRPDEPHSYDRLMLGKLLEPVVRPITDEIIGDVRPVLRVVLGAALLLLLVTCVNVANLVLLRVLSRRREFAVRASLGAGTARIAQQLIVEAGLLSVVGAAVGVAFAGYIVGLFARVASFQLPRAREVHMNTPALLAAIVICVLVAIACGVLPALATRRASLLEDLRERTAIDSRRLARRMRSTLVGMQVAIAVAVLVGASILGRSFYALAHEHLGFTPEKLAVARVAQSRTVGDAKAWNDVVQHAVERIRTMPGVDAATPLSVKPFLVNGTDIVYTLPGDTPGDVTTRPMVDYLGADADYFRTLGIPLIGGRVFSNDDRRGTTPVAVVDELLAHQAWPGQSPIGKRIAAGDMWYTVIGVVATTRYRDVLASRATMYTAFAQSRFIGMDVPPPYYVAVRSSIAPSKLVPALKRAVHDADARLFLTDDISMGDRIDASLATQRLSAVLLGAFATAILLLAGIGLYSVAATFVRYREFEIGIRVAIGATPLQVIRLVALQGLTIIAAGVGVGLLIALAGGTVLRSIVYGSSVRDPVSFGGAAVAVLVVAVSAFLLPSRRASRANPADVLRAG